MTEEDKAAVKEIRLAIAKMHDLLKESCEAIEKLGLKAQDESDLDEDSDAGVTVDDLDEAQGSIENAMQELKETIATLKRVAPDAQ